MIFWGVFVVPVLPYVLLDVVLTPEQLKDASRCDETLALLQAPNSYHFAGWIAGGVVVTVTSALLLRQSKLLCETRPLG